MKEDKSGFSNSCLLFTFLALFFLAGAFAVYFFLPTDFTETQFVAESEDGCIEPDYDNFEPTFVTYLNEYAEKTSDANLDNGLKLYREPDSRAAVEWFYIHVTGKRDVALSILEEAEKNDIPLSLAFSLAYTESRYNSKAVNKNSNESIDRGLFQLNSNSFPSLSEEDFFNPAVSAKFGMSHLKFCLNTAGNEVSGLAMYNAGTNKVRSNKTPQSTLNYVGKIINYQDTLDKLFEDEVASYFENRLSSGVSVAMAAKN
ncbi:MAG: transglycosylase SLT domain-containing protein [Treponema sp.]|nr:transglycosylase SLT domain-containing protein [Treponema sp.]